MLNQILASAGVNVTLHNTDVTYIVSITNISTTSASLKTHTPIYYHLHRPFLPQKEVKNK